ncbi:reverse transcriptase [Corchorus capsularis]|uniref:Reverse transcriptase n=1 Tax=Corchorus capsularis TaxID=210143 RepID=A0A1R3FYG6_COCAP|nr:reverse transcriptase [Corchorus capsularis]
MDGKTEMETRGRSGEEDDQLQRSTKKVKAPEGPSDGHVPAALSFKEAMLGGRRNMITRFDELGSLELDEGLISITQKDGWPSISLSENFKAHIRNQWKDCIIVKLLGVGFCVAKFSSLDDLRRVMDGGPWTVFGHYLTIRRWQPDFNPDTTTIESTVVWVHFPGLPIEYFHSRLLMAIGNTLEKAVKVFFEDRWLSVEYEGLKHICFQCGRAGTTEQCALCPKPAVTEIIPAGKGDDHSGAAGDFGPWMIVQPRKPRKSTNQNLKSRTLIMAGSGVKDGSRVSALAEGGENLNLDASSGNLSAARVSQAKCHMEDSGGRTEGSCDFLEDDDLMEDNFISAGLEAGEKSSDVRFRNPPDKNYSASGVLETQFQDARRGISTPKHLLMNFIIWNSRGTGNKTFRHHAIDMISTYKPSIMAVVELRVSGATARRVLRRLKMPKFHIADPEGFAGGIWLCWEESILSLEVVFSSPQLVHAFVERPGESKFLLSVIYASPILEIRRRLWDSLIEFAGSVDVPWLVMGDFNDVLSSNEKLGGSVPNIGRCLSFSSMILTYGLIDLGFNGSSFTWVNKRKGLARVQERLDRALANSDWRLRFPDAIVQHLPRLHSDHCPILIRCEPVLAMNRSQRPFRFQGMWLSHEGFTAMIDGLWNSLNGNLWGKGEKLTMSLQDWNREEFGNIFERKKKLRARIAGLQRSLSLHYSHQLQLLENGLIREYNQILVQEETFWAQKSRVQWLQQGEKNTRFFHLSTICRRRRNRITMLRDGNGDWVTEIGPLQELVLSYFRDLYTEEEEGKTMLEPLSQPVISSMDGIALAREISPCEVRTALFQTKPWKAPGVDGFQAGFYKKMLGFSGEGLSGFRPFRPISLCTVAYKLITKVLVNRLGPLLGDLIGHLQSSFIPGRQAADNIFIAQEMIHTVKKSRSKNGLMAVKIDLEKAYDRVSWDFLRDTIMAFNFPPSWINLIIFCVESASMSVLWNGEKTEMFHPGRGLWQGDPLSPYPFVLCMEHLGHLILDESQATCIRRVLDTFCAASGARVRLYKSKLYISPHVSRRNAQKTSEILGINSSNDLGKYLGVPLIHGRVVKDTFREMVDKVCTRLNGWKYKFLSLAGRATLISLVTSSIPTYNMLTVRIPQGTIVKLDSMNRRFLWGGSEEKRALHLVCWEDVCRPKIMGGLGLRSMALHNRVLLQKTTWRFLMEPNSLWVKLLRAKYAIPSDVVGFVNSHVCKPSWSYSWRGLFGAIGELSRGLKWRIGTGSHVGFWTDLWLDKPILTELDVIPSHANSAARVSDFIDATGHWNMDFIFAQVPLDVAMKIIAYPLPRVGVLHDAYVWASTPNGKFTTRSAYLNLLNEAGTCLEGSMSWMWKLPIPVRWTYFLWLARRGRLVTNELRLRWGLTTDASCVICGANLEDILHVLRDCIEAKRHVILFATTYWRLWTRRCNHTFQEEGLALDQSDVVQNIMISTTQICALQAPDSSLCLCTKHIHWFPPTSPSVKLNTDEASCGNPGLSGAGGLLRDFTDKWLVGFSAHLGITTNIAAELHALRLGLILAWDEGYRHVECEIDASVVLSLIDDADLKFQPFSSLILDIRELLKREWECKCLHTLREGNFCADVLSKMRCSLDEDYVVFRQPPVEMKGVL